MEKRCEMTNCKEIARYRWVGSDLTGLYICEKHIGSEKERAKEVREGLLERIFDYNLKTEVEPVSLKPY